ncbi:MAG: branched-chain amino acid ABC transporter permease [Candidatus Geothermarchaeales archaeon]
MLPDPSFFFAQLLIGVVMGVIYSLMALGLTLIFGVMKVVNFAHGVLYMLGGFVSYYLITLWNVHFALALPLAMATVFLIGVVIEKLLLKPMYTGDIERPGEYSIIVTFGLSIFLSHFAIIIFGPFYHSPLQVSKTQLFGGFLGETFRLGLFGINGTRLYAFLVAILFIAGTILFLKKTWTGRALQAAAQNKVGAQIVGINLRNIHALAFGLGAALATAAGTLLAPVFYLFPEAGTFPAIKGFVIIVLGGMGSVPGSIIGGLLLGTIETIGSVAIGQPGLKDFFGFMVLVVVLFLKPTGLMGERERTA